VFPATANLAAGQVLKATLVSTGSTCSGAVVDVSQISTRFCNPGSFNPNATPFCGNTSTPHAVAGTTTVFLPVDIAVSPQTINVACQPKKDNGIVKFTIFGSTSVDVTQINQSSLALEGQKVVQPAKNCSESDVNGDGFLDLSCSVPSCPTLGTNLGNEQPNQDGTSNIELTGSLNSTLKIQGEDTVKTSGK